MPRKTKEAEEIPVKNAKKDTTRKTATRAISKPTKNTKSTKNTETKSVSKNKPSSTKTSKTEKVAKTSKVEKAKVITSSKSAKTTTSKKNKPSRSNKVTKATESKTISKSNLISVIEYYDLPYRYNQTIVKILAQTPKMLFVYWDISDDDKKSFEQQYGNNFFSNTKPVLIIHNETMNYSFEIEINDFANSWYLHVNDTDCKYMIELGRRPLPHINSLNTNYIYVSSSNEMTSPNNHILFEKFNPNVTYKNIKNGHVSKKEFANLANYKNIQAIYNIYDLYKMIYKDDLFCEITNEGLTTPSSLSSSNFK